MALRIHVDLIKQRFLFLGLGSDLPDEYHYECLILKTHIKLLLMIITTLHTAHPEAHNYVSIPSHRKKRKTNENENY